MDLAEAPASRPWVTMETLDPDTGNLKMDWARYRERRGALVPFSCETEQWQWDFGPHLEARYDRTLLPATAFGWHISQSEQDRQALVSLALGVCLR